MVSGLHQADRADALLARTLEHGFHQLATNGSVLHAGIDRDRSHPSNRVRLPKKVAADYTPIPFRDDGVDRGGSACLNSSTRWAKWSPAGFRLLRLAAAG